jgi:hypothetical protein
VDGIASGIVIIGMGIGHTRKLYDQITLKEIGVGVVTKKFGGCVFDLY